MKTIVKRSDKVAFFGVVSEDSVTFHRMTGFTDLSTSKNPAEYSRQYVDESFETTDVIGYSPSMSYNFDQFTENPVHEDIVSISDNEMIGNAAVRSILVVDFTKEGETEGTFKARKRDFAVIPDSEGDGTEAFTYSGTFKVKGETVVGTVTSTDSWQTCTFTEDE